jgi:glucan phosphoethanolaminetransferase (alkaline phosphatase superfamily)
MLQRIQTVLLLLTAIALGVFLGTSSFVRVIGPDEKVVVNAFHLFHQKGSLPLLNTPIYYVATAAILALVLTIYTIFQYKNRIRQMLFVALNSLLIGVALAATVYHIQNDAIKIGNAAAEGSYGIGLWAAFVALACNWLANRFIKKDEKLVKSADRMR